jgi:hypothetical protein
MIVKSGELLFLWYSFLPDKSEISELSGGAELREGEARYSLSSA